MAAWVAINGGTLNSLPVYGFVKTGSTLFAATYGGQGVYKSTNNGTTWVSAHGTGLTNSWGQCFTLSGSTLVFGTYGGGIFTTINEGSTWSATNLTTQNVVALMTADNGDLFAATYGNGMYKSTNGGSIWSSCNTGITPVNMWCLATYGSTLYAASRDDSYGVYVSTNYGGSWSQINGTGLTDLAIWSIAVDESNVYVGTYNTGVFRTTNGGSTWTRVKTSQTRSVAKLNGNLFNGTTSGVYVSLDSGDTWGSLMNPPGSLYSISMVAIGDACYAGFNNEGAYYYYDSVTANFTGTPTSGYLPLSVVFTDTSAGSPTTWAWTFGDGGTSTDRNPTYVYSTDGTYTVSLTASKVGSSDTKTITSYITVKEMHYVYVDINNAYTSTGDGSSGSPLNWLQLYDHFYDAATDTTYYIRGLRTLVNSYEWIEHADKSAEIIVNFLPWDDEPWIVDGGGVLNWEILNDTKGYAQITIDRLYGNFGRFILNLFNNRPAKATNQHVMKRCHIKIANAINDCIFYSDNYSTIPFKISGCTFDSSRRIGFYEPGKIAFQDCFFGYLDPYYHGFFIGDPLSTITFSDCYFVNALTDLVWDGAALSTATRDPHCVASYVLPNPLPDPSTATTANKDLFNFSLFGIPFIVYTAEVTRWAAENYNTGSFGEPRRSIGAFYFRTALTYYINIDDAYADLGNAGTEADPFNSDEFQDHVYYNEISCTYFVKGFRTINEGTFWYYEIWNGSDLSFNIDILPWENAPFVFYDNEGVYFDIGSNGGCNITIKNMAVYSGYRLRVQPNQYSEERIGSIIFKDCYISWDNVIQLYPQLVLDHSISFKGCTFNPTYPENSSFWMFSPYIVDFTDCYFGKFENEFALQCSHIENIIQYNFVRCIFENDSSAMLFDYSEGDSPLSAGSLINCETSHSSPIPLPLATHCTLAYQSDLNYTNYGLHKIEDPIIIAIWIAEDYNTGLFGEERLGIGSFYFGTEVLTADFIAAPTSGYAPLTVTFTDTSLGTPTSWDWDFGDGASSTDQNPTHTYNNSDTYTVILTVSDGVDISTKTDYISSRITIDATPRFGIAPLDVILSTPYTGLSFLWDMGDGTTSTNPSPRHTYNTVGQHTVSLSVTNSSGQVAPAYEPNFIAVGKLDFGVNPDIGKLPLSVQFINKSSAPTGCELSYFVWDFGDGSRGVTGYQAVHTYRDKGKYVPTLNATLTKI